MMMLRRFALLLSISFIMSACTCEPGGGGEELSEAGQSEGGNEQAVQDSTAQGPADPAENEDSPVVEGSEYAYDPTAPEVAVAHCQSCHLLPGAADHRKRDWPIVMGHMAWWMGMSDDELPKIESRLPADDFSRVARKRNELLSLGAIGEAPLIDAETWVAVLDAYVNAAPETLQDPAASIQYTPWRNATVASIGAGTLNGLVISALHLDESASRMLIGETSFSANGLAGTVYAWTAGDGFGQSATFVNAPTAVEPSGDDLLVTNIGSLFPSNDDDGSLWRVDGQSWEKSQVLSEIPRTPHALPMANGDLLVSSFGHEVGRLWVAEMAENGVFVSSQELVKLPGATESIAADIDGDGIDEYLVLFGQGIDGVYVVERTGGGDAWNARIVIQRSPAFGHSDMSISDIDADGDLDILLANGDNLDLPDSPARPYHGVRIYENDGAGNFTESYFFPMHGAYGVEAGNFDADDELELAAVAYFLEPATASQNFVILDRDEHGEWLPFGLDAVSSGQFCRIAVGNIDESPTDEVFLGGCYRQPPGPDAPRLVEVSFQ